MADVAGLARAVGVAAAALVLLAPRASSAGVPPAPEGGEYVLRLDAPATGVAAGSGLRLAMAAPAPALRLSLGAEAAPQEYRQNFLVPAIEVPALVLVLNWGNRLAGREWAEVNGFNNFWNHLFHGPWVYDTDEIKTNFSEHPYNGSVYYNMARSSGLDFYWSFGFSFLGSLLWELGGEAEPPSKSDQVMTPVGGTFLGEALYRSFALILSGGSSPGFWREASAFVVSPAAGFNRLLFGDQYRSAVWDEQPTVFYRVSAGGGVGRNHDPSGEREDGGYAAGTFQMEYGQPADPGFRVRRPFDTFMLRLSLGDGAGGVAQATQVHGAIAGWRLDAGPFRGIWGILGNYDFINAGVYRVGSAALGVGAIGEFAFSGTTSLGASLSLLGVLMGAAGATTQPVGGRDYHIGPGTQANLELRLYLDTVAMIDLSARQFLIGPAAFPGWEDITYSTLGAYFRLAGHHGIALILAGSRRTARYPDVPDVKQNASTLTLNYAWISDKRFGAARRVPAAE
jgi:hypothetical protein